VLQVNLTFGGTDLSFPVCFGFRFSSVEQPRKGAAGGELLKFVSRKNDHCSSRGDHQFQSEIKVY
jgi:hypothetical protein